jgi:hypothetical protein
LPPPPTRDTSQALDQGEEPALGVVLGGLQSAEALGLARYLMFSQVYYHPIRQIYDLHLQDFLKEWLPSGSFSTEVSQHMQITDNEVTAAMASAAGDTTAPGHEPARCIMRREHFKVLYEGKPDDLELSPEPGKAVFYAAQERFGTGNVKHQSRPGSGGAKNFPCLCEIGPLPRHSLCLRLCVASQLPAQTTSSSVPIMSMRLKPGYGRIGRTSFVRRRPRRTNEESTAGSHTCWSL